MANEYQALLNSMFVCGLKDVDTVIKNEGIDVVLDLRAEAQEGHEDHVERIKIPLEDGIENQTQLLKQAIQYAVRAYHQGNKVLLH